MWAGELRGEPDHGRAGYIDGKVGGVLWLRDYLRVNGPIKPELTAKHGGTKAISLRIGTTLPVSAPCSLFLRLSVSFFSMSVPFSEERFLSPCFLWPALECGKECQVVPVPTNLWRI